MAEESRRVIRSLTIDDKSQVALICKDVYGGLDQTPVLFQELISKSNSYSHAVVDAVSNELLGFQLIDVIDDGQTAWFHTLRVAPWARRLGIASQLQRHQFAFVARELSIHCVRYSTNTIDTIPRAFALKNEMVMVHQVQNVCDLPDSGVQFYEIMSRTQDEIRSEIPNLQRIHQEHSHSIIDELIASDFLGNHYVQYDWKSLLCLSSNILPFVEHGIALFLKSTNAPNTIPINNQPFPSHITSTSLFHATETKYTGCIIAYSRQEFLAHLCFHISQFKVHKDAAVAAASSAVIFRFECFYPKFVEQFMSDEELKQLHSAPNPYTGTALLTWEKDVSSFASQS